MKNLNFSGPEKNYYHILKEYDLIREGQFLKGKAMITGFTKQEINVDDVIEILKVKYNIKEITERRNHAGEFKNPDDKINSFFEVQCEFQRVITF